MSFNTDSYEIGKTPYLVSCKKCGRTIELFIGMGVAMCEKCDNIVMTDNIRTRHEEVHIK